MPALILVVAYAIGSLIRSCLRSIWKIVVQALTVLVPVAVSIALIAEGVLLDRKYGQPQPIVIYVPAPQVVTPPPDPESTIVARYCGISADAAGTPIMVTSDGVLVLASGWRGNMVSDSIVTLTVTTHIYHVIDNGNGKDYTVRTVHMAMPPYGKLASIPAPCGT